jgi:aryl-alcohol dehydrogenase-like predicted oxidoreductase
MAAAKSCQPAQIALSWVLGRGDHVMALTGTTKLANLKSNLGAYDVSLTTEEQALLDSLADRVKGDRYDEWGMQSING